MGRIGSAFLVVFIIFCNQCLSQTGFPFNWKYHAGDDSAWSVENFNDQSWTVLQKQAGTKIGKSWFRTRLNIPGDGSSTRGVLVLTLPDFGPGQQLYWNGRRILSREEMSKKSSLKNILLHYYILDVNGTTIHWGKENTVALKTELATTGNNVFGEGDFAYQYIPAASDFGYAFALPHRLTVGLPTNSNRTLLDAYENSLKMSWTYGNLKYYPFISFRPLWADWELMLTPLLDNKPFLNVHWTRAGSYLPVLQNSYVRNQVKFTMETAGADTATLVKIVMVNNGNENHEVNLRIECAGAWCGYSPNWLDSTLTADRLLAGWNAPADQILVLGMGADHFQTNGSTSFIMKWQLHAGETKTAWLIRPYNSFNRQAPSLQQEDWNTAFAESKVPWMKIKNAATAIQVPDSMVYNAFYASLLDCFIMREPIGNGYISEVMGTEGYRSGPSNFEPSLVAVALDQVGLHKDAEEGLRVDYDLQEPNGDWTEPGGWGHLMWGGTGFKAWALMEHFYLSRDTTFLKKRYPQLLASSRWQNAQRAKSKSIKGLVDSMTYGLMPRGMGDCGLKNGEDPYGIFYPHNLWSVFADSLSLAAAHILNKPEDIVEMEGIYYPAKKDLLRSLKTGAIESDQGFRWIPGVPAKQSGSRWGALNASFPTGILPADHELINGTLKYMNQNLSPGGLQMNTGWLKNGMWVAIALDNVAENQLIRNEGDEAAGLLMATLNHGTPLYTWCEERGPEPYTDTITGDRQHLWTPVAIVRYLRDALIMEGNGEIFLAKGVDRNWMLSGKKVGIQNAPTHAGIFSYAAGFDKDRAVVTGTVDFPADNTMSVIWYARLPKGYRLKAVNKNSGAELLPDGSGLKWKIARGVKKFQVSVLKYEAN